MESEEGQAKRKVKQLAVMASNGIDMRGVFVESVTNCPYL
jgi:hypothetical protein